MRNLLDRASRVPEPGGFRTAALCRPHPADNRRQAPLSSGLSEPDEVLIVDARASLRPAQLVERKLIFLLKSVYLPVSHVRTTALCNGRDNFSALSSESDRKVCVPPPTGVRVAGPEHESQVVAPLCCPSTTGAAAHDPARCSPC